jgi:hypothetical protein
MWNTYAVAAQVDTCAAFAHVEYLCSSCSSGILVQHLLIWNTFAVAAQVLKLNTCAAAAQDEYVIT